jgi:hypothetical protein
MRRDVIFFPRNALSGMQHGGSKRSRQILDLLEKEGFQVVVSPSLQCTLNRFQRLVTGLRYYLQMPKADREKINNVKSLTAIGFMVSCYMNLLSDHPRATLLVEQISKFGLLVDIANRYQRNLVCIPHDIEVLGFTDTCIDISSTVDKLRLELRFLSRASSVFTIGLEDQWLLRNFQIAAKNLPSFPSESQQKRLARIRDARASSQKDHILLVGTAEHPPTGVGMLEALRWKSMLKRSDANWVVAGYGTEKFASEFESPSCQVLGTISDEVLDNLLINSRAAVLHQLTGSGALTRVPELLCAGVPVIASSHAARSYWHWDGVRSYDTKDQLEGILNDSLWMQRLPKCPEPPLLAEKDLVACIDNEYR